MTSRQQSLELFDSLEPVDTEFRMGRWRGDGYPTDHPLDGLLEIFHWYGKLFESTEDVHPLLFSNRRGKLVHVNPGYMKPTFALGEHMSKLESKTIGDTFRFLLPLVSTSKSRARLRMTEYRGKTSATMIYDQLPINDIFRKLDDSSVLGVMDNKLLMDPFFFKLTKDD